MRCCACARKGAHANFVLCAVVRLMWNSGPACSTYFRLLRVLCARTNRSWPRTRRLPADRAAIGAQQMQDPFHAVKEEVEHSVTVVIDLHKRWHELSASSKKGDEWEWTACASASEE